MNTAEIRPSEWQGEATRRGEKRLIAHDFGVAAASYDAAARLQRLMGQALLARLPDQAFPRVLDLGCGTGLFLEPLRQAAGAVDLTAIDLSADMLAFARRTRPVDARFLAADAEALPLADASQDLVFSNLMIQWCDDPRPALRECFRVLRPGGWLLCSTLLDGTLRELASAWDAVDPGQAHINSFDTGQQLAAALADVFTDGALQRQTWALDYEQPAALLRELKDLGANHKSPERRRALTGPSRLRRLYNHYPRQPAGQVVATYEAAYILARRPLESS